MRDQPLPDAVDRAGLVLATRDEDAVTIAEAELSELLSLVRRARLACVADTAEQREK